MKSNIWSDIISLLTDGSSIFYDYCNDSALNNIFKKLCDQKGLQYRYYDTELANNSSELNTIKIYKSIGPIKKQGSHYYYHLVPSINNPRWLIYAERDTIKNHGPIIKPSTLLARFIWKIALVLNRINLFNLMFPYTIECSNQLCSSLIKNKNDLAEICYTGARGPDRRNTIKCQTYADNTIYYLKVGFNKGAKDQIALELQALKHMSTKEYHYLIIPILSFYDFNPQYYLLVQNNILVDQSISNFISTIDLRMFVEMILNTTTKHGFINEFDILEYAIDKWSRKSAISMYLAQKTNCPVALSTSHGDYTKWNRFISSGKCLVFDWENYSTRPILYDLCFFHFNENIMVKKMPFNKTLSIIERDSNALLSILSKAVPAYSNIDLRCHIIINCIMIIRHYSNNGSSSNVTYINALSSGLEGYTSEYLSGSK